MSPTPPRLLLGASNGQRSGGSSVVLGKQNAGRSRPPKLGFGLLLAVIVVTSLAVSYSSLSSQGFADVASPIGAEGKGDFRHDDDTSHPASAELDNPAPSDCEPETTTAASIDESQDEMADEVLEIMDPDVDERNKEEENEENDEDDEEERNEEKEHEEEHEENEEEHEENEEEHEENEEDSEAGLSKEDLELELSILPPPGYPWFLYRDASERLEHETANRMGSATVLSAAKLLEKLEQILPDDMKSRPVPIPYFITPSIELVARRRHFDSADELGGFGARRDYFEILVKEALELAKRGVKYQPRFQRLLEGDLPLLWEWDDFGTCGNEYPRLTPCRPVHMTAEQCTAIPVPNFASWEEHVKNKGIVTRQDIDEKILARNEAEYPWSSKQPMAVWRGSTTGSQHILKPGQTWRDLQRFRMVFLGQENKDIMDVAFAHVVQMNEKEEREIRNETEIKDSMGFEDFQKYRAILDVEGNSWSSRFGRLLCTNSVIIKLKAFSVDYFHDELVPWVHYVPAEMDTLVDVVRYVVDDKNQGAMQNIVAAANDWCRSKMHGNAMARDMLWILVLYVEMLDKADENWKTPWQESEVAHYSHYDDIITVEEFWRQKRADENENSNSGDEDGGNDEGSGGNDNGDGNDDNEDGKNDSEDGNDDNKDGNGDDEDGNDDNEDSTVETKWTEQW